MKERYLFRGKRIDNGVWVVGNLAVHTDERTIRNENTTRAFIFPKVIFRFDDNSPHGVTGIVEIYPETIGQCTGLRSTLVDGEYVVFKNPNDGKLIFDGDIISVSAYSYTEPEAYYFGVVTVGSYGYGLYNENAEVKFLYFNDIQGSYITHYEVLGNIHDNPELLHEPEATT